MKRFAVSTLVGAVALAVLSTSASAQNVFLGGGPSIPMGDYKDYAKTGWLLQGGLGIDVGNKGMFIEGEAFFGSNAHENTGNFKDKTNIIAFMAALGKSFGAADAKVSPYVLAGAGIVGHQFRTDDDDRADEEATENKFGYTGAVGVAFRLNEKAKFWVEGRFLGSSGTNVIPFAAGISISLGGGS